MKRIRLDLVVNTTAEDARQACNSLCKGLQQL